MRKTRLGVLIVVISVVLFIFSSVSVIAPQSDPSCCTLEISSDYCLLGGYLDGSYPNQEDCCGPGQTCAEFKNNVNCDETLCANLGKGIGGSGFLYGCCIDTCEDVQQDQCQGGSQWKPGSCASTTACLDGCCRCQDQDRQDLAALNFLTNSQCREECMEIRNSYQYAWDFNTDDCKPGTYIEKRYTFSGKVTSADKPDGLQDVDVVMVGVGVGVTDSAGQFEIRDILPGDHKISLSKSRYRPIYETIKIGPEGGLKSKDFDMVKLTEGLIKGSVVVQNTLEPIPGATIEIGGYDSTFTADKDGKFTIYLPIKQSEYDLKISKTGYHSLPKNKDARLPVLVDGEVEKEFALTPKKTATIRFREKNGKQKVIVDITGYGSCVTKSSDGVSAKCEYPETEDDKVLEVPEGTDQVTYTWNARKDEKHKIPGGTVTITQADIDKAYQDGIRYVKEVEVDVSLRSDLCNYEGEYVRRGTCSKANQPYYCVNGYLDLNLQQITNELKENTCRGMDEIEGGRCIVKAHTDSSNMVFDGFCVDGDDKCDRFNAQCIAGRCQLKGNDGGRVLCGSDNLCSQATYPASCEEDCGCPPDFTCQNTGYCRPSATQCTDTCTYSGGDLTCHKGCDGIGGCNFYNPTGMVGDAGYNPNDPLHLRVEKACDGKLVNSIVNVDGRSYACCEGSPATFGDEDCTTPGTSYGQGDEDLDGKPQCDDENCFHEKCDSTNSAFICRGVKGILNGEPYCERKLCPDGLIDAKNAGCRCGDIVDGTDNKGPILQQGGYCCPITKTGFSNKDSYGKSICGNTECKRNSGQCCLGGCKANGPGESYDLIFFQTIAGGNGCVPDDGMVPSGVMTMVQCCPQDRCKESIEFVCDRDECDTSDQIVSSPTHYVDFSPEYGQVGCKKPCKPTLRCEVNTRINSIANFQKGKCKCGTEIKNFPNRQDNSLYDSQFCCTEDDLIKVKYSRCEGAPIEKSIKGDVVDTDGNKIPEAFIRTTKGPRQDWSNLEGGYNMEVIEGLNSFTVTKDGYQILNEDVIVESHMSHHFVLNFFEDNCDSEPKPVLENSFSAEHIRGEVLKVLLKWSAPPCQNLRHYIITPSFDETKAFQVEKDMSEFTYLLTQDDTMDSIQGPYGDKISFDIQVVYGTVASGSDLDVSGIEKSNDFIVGDRLCDGIYDSEFCSLDRTQILTCDDENQVDDNNENCNPDADDDGMACLGDPDDFECTVCSGPDKNGKAKCQIKNVCDLYSQDAYPFGLYYQKEKCLYGENADAATNTPNYCYYDSFVSSFGIRDLARPSILSNKANPTIINRCTQCDEQMSCLNYRSEDACVTDNCGVAKNNECKWLKTSYHELGNGICYQEAYQGFDRCGFCGMRGEAFQNTLCDQTICSSLGACYSNPDNSSCLSCEYATCEDLLSEQQCNNGQNFEINDYVMTASNDVCNLGKCKWLAKEDRCIKDGNDNVALLGTDGEDCEEELERNTETEFQFPVNCRKDTDSPITSLIFPSVFNKVGAGISNQDLGLSSSSSRQTFLADLIFTTLSAQQGGDRTDEPESNGLWFHYCVDNSNTCDPTHRTLSYSDGVVRLFDDGKRRDLVTATGQSISTGSYYLRYFSVDKHFNQEDVQSILFYADVQPPTLDIKTEVFENIDNINPVTPAAKSKIDVKIKSSEEATCDHSLQKFSTNGLSRIDGQNGFRLNLNQEFKKEHIFGDGAQVLDGTYLYTIQCYDNMGNFVKESRHIRVDAYRKLEIVFPPLSPADGSVLNTPEVRFKVKTDDKSKCYLVTDDLRSCSNSPEDKNACGPQFESLNGVDHIYPGHSLQNPSEFLPPMRIGSNSKHFLEYRVSCKDVEDSTIPADTGSFIFTVDMNDPVGQPNVSIRLDNQDGDGPYATSIDGWRNVTGKPTTVVIECSDPFVEPNIPNSHYGPFDNSDFDATQKLGCITNDFPNPCNPLPSGGDPTARKSKQDFLASTPITQSEKICYTCKDDGGNIGSIKCGIVIVDNRPPGIQVTFTSTDLEGRLEILPTIQDVPVIKREGLSKFYDINIEILGEESTLEKLPTVNLLINGSLVLENLPVDRMERVGNQKFKSLFAVPHTQEFEALNELNNLTFYFTASDNFGNEAELYKQIIIDTSVPPPPILNTFPETTSVKFLNSTDVNPGSLFRQTGFDAEAAPKRPITIKFGTRPNNLHPHVSGFGLPTINLKSDLVYSTVTYNDLVADTAVDPVFNSTALVANITNVSDSSHYLTLESIDSEFDTSRNGGYVDFPRKRLPTFEYYSINSIRPIDERYIIASSLGVTEDKISSTSQPYTYQVPNEFDELKLYTTVDLDSSTKFLVDLRDDYVGEEVRIYNHPVPLAWFNQPNIKLEEGSNWFYGYATDFVGNIGEKTLTKKLVLDGLGPEMKSNYPLNSSSFSYDSNVRISSMFKDVNSGVNINSVNITVNNESFRCTPARCSGSKTFGVIMESLDLANGKNNVSISLSDWSGNQIHKRWSFVVNDTAPRQFSVKPQKASGVCLPYGQCYVNNTKPTLELVYTHDVNISKSILYSKHGNDGEIIELGNNKFNVTPFVGLDEGNHYAEIFAHRVLHGADGKLLLPEIHINYLPFIIDTTKPQINVDLLEKTNKQQITLSGSYSEENVHKIEFTGDIEEEKTLLFWNLPTDLVDEDTYLYSQDVLLNLTTNSSSKKIDINIFDLANNNVSISLNVLYDATPPNITNVSVEVDEGKGLVVFATSQFKTNDNDVKIKGKFDKDIKRLVLQSNKISKLAQFDNQKKTFQVGFDIKKSLNQQEKEDILLIAEDELGNKGYHNMNLEFDVFSPNVEIKWT